LGFTEDEVFAGLDECGLSEKKECVKRWYDGFTFGHYTDIYNPWSVLNFLDTGKLGIYWANTSSNSLVGKLIREGAYPEVWICFCRQGSVDWIIDIIEGFRHKAGWYMDIFVAVATG